MLTKELGIIKDIYMGMGGFENAMFGLSITVGRPESGWCAQDFIGSWDRDADEFCKWTNGDRDVEFLKASLKIRELLKLSKKRYLYELKGTPVEAIFEDNILKSWRVLIEVI